MVLKCWCGVHVANADTEQWNQAFSKNACFFVSAVWSEAKSVRWKCLLKVLSVCLLPWIATTITLAATGNQVSMKWHTDHSTGIYIYTLSKKSLRVFNLDKKWVQAATSSCHTLIPAFILDFWLYFNMCWGRDVTNWAYMWNSSDHYYCETTTRTLCSPCELFCSFCKVSSSPMAVSKVFCLHDGLKLHCPSLGLLLVDLSSHMN